MNLQTIGVAIGSAHKNELPEELKPLRLTNVGSASTTIKFNDIANAHPELMYRKQEGADWQSWDYTDISLQPNEYIEICGDNASSITGYQEGPDYGSQIVSSGEIGASGNIMSLLYKILTPENILEIPEDIDYAFACLFSITGLKSAPILSATKLTKGCYLKLFASCSFEYPPALPAEGDLPESCYSQMFMYNAQLKESPILPADFIYTSSYNMMFYHCSSLRKITCLATDMTSGATAYWVDGVAATGTFIKAAAMSGWTTGKDGIPSGWTVENI